jgi:sensor histidine kinase YesM
LYIKLEQIRLNFKYNIEIQEDLEQTQIFTMLIQPYVENAIWHGLSDTNNEEKHLQIIIKGDKDAFLIQILDNGRGMKKAVTNVSNEHISFAMSGVKKRIEVINQLYDVRIDINVIDRSELSDNKQSGTLVEIKQTIK